MSADAAKDDFAAQVLESRDPDLRRLVASGLAPLPLPDLLALQVQLIDSGEPEVVEAASKSLAELKPKIIASVIADGADERVLRYFGLQHEHPMVLEAVLGLRTVPRDLLAEMARQVPANAQEILLHRQDAIVEHPAILDALEENDELTSYSRRRIAEYREHLLPRESRPDEPDEPGEVIDPDDEVDEEQVAELREEFAALEDAAEEAEFETLYRASEIKIRTLPVALRMRLARGATPLLRRILIRDQNSNVALSIMKFSPITEGEVERIALSRVVVDEVLTHIANSKSWIRKYKVVFALCQNPRSPLNVTMRLLPRLSARDLQHLSRSRNVSDAVRRRALRLYRIKIQ